jgi:hypothetical protein
MTYEIRHINAPQCMDARAEQLKRRARFEFTRRTSVPRPHRSDLSMLRCVDQNRGIFLTIRRSGHIIVVELG